MGIESVGGGQSQQISQQMDVAAMVSPDTAQVQQLAAQVAPLISSMSNLCVQETQRTEEGEKTHETTNAPRLDEAELEAIAANSVDLEALIAELQAETDKVQVLVSKERIEGMKGELEAQNEQSLQKISESLDAIAEQQKQDKLNSILGWVGVAFAILGVVAAVFTGGAAAIALATVGAALAVTMQVLNETGAMDDIMQSISDWVHGLDTNNELSSEAEDAIAAAIIAAIEIAISVIMICAGQAGKAGSSIAKCVSQGAQKAIQVASTVANATMAVVGIGASARSAVVNYEAGMAQADVTEMDAILKQLQELLDQESEDLQAILQSMNDSLAAVIELLGSKQDTLNAISMNIGA